MQNDTNTQTKAQILININDINKEMNKLFTKVYKVNNSLIAPLNNDKTKVKSIKAIKEYLNKYYNLYSLSIIFMGGISQEYKTAIRIDLIL